jgi:sulfate permease, SulP family
VGLPAHKEFALNLLETVRHIGQTDFMAFGVFLAFFVFLLGWKKLVPKVPGPLPAAVLGIAVGYAASYGYLPGVMTLHDKFPALSFSLFQIPSPSLFGWGTDAGVLGWLSANSTVVSTIVSTAIVIAIIATLETLIAGKIAEKLTKTKFDKDIEVRGAGIANIVSGLLGGMPATAVLVRTALNAKSGANHRTSAFLASFFTLAISWVCFSAFTYLPVPVVSAILMNIAVAMVETHIYGKMYRFDRKGFFITFVVALVSIFEDPMYGVVIGTLVTLVLFVIKLSDGDMEVSVFRDGEFAAKRRFSEYLADQSSDDLLIYKFSGPLNFLNVSNQIDRIQKLDNVRAVVFTFNHVVSVDIDGIEAIEEQIEHLRSRGIDVAFSGLSNGVGTTVESTHVYHELAAKQRIFPSSSVAIQSLAA